MCVTLCDPPPPSLYRAGMSADALSPASVAFVVSVASVVGRWRWHSIRWLSRQHLFTTMIYTAGVMLGAMFCPGLSIALSLAGILVVVIDLIFPGFMLIAITKSARGKAAGWALVGMGTVIGVISTYTTVTAIISDVKNHKF